MIPNDTSFVSRVALLAGRGTGPEGSQGGGYLFRPDRPCWVTRIADQPFEFDAYPLRRACFKGDPVNVRLGVRLRESRPLDHNFNPTRWV